MKPALPILFALALTLAVGVCCAPKPAPTVPSFAGPASPSASAACFTLTRIGCAEGQDPQCPLVLDRRNIAKIVPVDVASAASAVTKSDARRAGVACP